MQLTNCIKQNPSIVKKYAQHDSDLPGSYVNFGACTYRSLICSWVNRPPFLCLSRSQGRLAVPALWPWHPKMLCLLPWPSRSLLMLTSKALIPLSESHMTYCSSNFCTHTHFCPYLNFNNTWCHMLQSVLCCNHLPMPRISFCRFVIVPYTISWIWRMLCLSMTPLFQSG